MRVGYLLQNFSQVAKNTLLAIAKNGPKAGVHIVLHTTERSDCDEYFWKAMGKVCVLADANEARLTYKGDKVDNCVFRPDQIPEDYTDAIIASVSRDPDTAPAAFVPWPPYPYRDRRFLKEIRALEGQLGGHNKNPDEVARLRRELEQKTVRFNLMMENLKRRR